jgi:uncharacterized protein (DUF362 family)
VIRVGLGRSEPGYAGVEPPFGPGQAWPELVRLLGDAAAAGPGNPAYAGVRAALCALGLDAARFGSADWNPLGELVARGGRVVLKPNFIRHWNPAPDGTPSSLITHGAVLRAMADYAWLAVGPEGTVVVAEAPQHDCDFARVIEISGLDRIARFYESTLGAELGVVDLRQEAVRYRDGVIVSRHALPGDPLGYRVVDLGARSFFHGCGLDPDRFRGADYDPGPTSTHHREGRNEYLLSETVLRADLVVNLPKLKTHKKTGVTLALKNLVGINGDKNWLPHHTLGSVAAGGDEYPGDALVDAARSRASEVARRWLARGRALGLLRLARRAEGALRGDAFVRAGNWYGNDTTWRMVLDLNRCLYYSAADGPRLDAERPVRRVLSVLDGIVAGEGEGPLAPRDRPLGVVLASTDPVALDLVAVRLMGFDERRIPKLREALRDPGPRLSEARSAADVRAFEADARSFEVTERELESLACEPPFAAHPGWRGHIEREARRPGAVVAPGPERVVERRPGRAGGRA